MWCSRAGRRRATWKWSDLRVNCTDGVISMLKYVGTGSEVTREIWEMKLLMLLPRLELGAVSPLVKMLIASFGSRVSFVCATPVVSLLHFVKDEFASEGIRQFFVDGEIEEVKLNTFCDLHETPRYGSSGFPVCLPRFALRVHSRCLDLVAQELWNLRLSRTWQRNWSL